MGARRRGGRADLPAGGRARDQLLGHGQRVRVREFRGDRRAGDRQVHQARRHRAGDQGVLQDARRAGRFGTVAQGHHGEHRRLALAARDRLRRPLPDPPLRSRDAGRGDDGGPARRRQGRQGPVPRRLVDVGLAVLQAPVHRRPAWLDPLRLHAEPVQPDAARGGTRDVRAARRPGRGEHPVEPARQGPASPARGARRLTAPTPIPSVSASSPPTTSRSPMPSSASPRPVASRWRTSPSPGC